MKNLFIFGQILFVFLTISNIAEGNTSGIFFCGAVSIVCTVMKHQDHEQEKRIVDTCQVEIVDNDGSIYPVTQGGIR